MKHDYKWARTIELTLYQFFFMCQAHAERFIAGDSSCYVLDDSCGEITAIRKGDAIIMRGGLYDIGGEWSEWYTLTSIRYDNDPCVLGARLAGTYADLIYQHSWYFRYVCLPVACKSPPMQVHDETMTEEELVRAIDESQLGKTGEPR